MNCHRIFGLATASFALFCITSPLVAQKPEWIWHDNKGARAPGEEVRFFRKNFTVEGRVTLARLTAAGDDEMFVVLNGKVVANGRNWHQPARVDVTKQVKEGENSLAAWARNANGAFGFIAKLELTLSDDRKVTIITDNSWLSSAVEEKGWEDAAFRPTAWTKAVSLGKEGVAPWGDVLAVPTATPASSLTVLPGFKVELIRSAEVGEGSWVSMTVDDKGRLIVSPQEGVGNLLRITLSDRGQVARIEKIGSPVGSAMGLLYAFDSLYVSGNGPKGLGLYRLRDTKGADEFDSVEFLRKFEGAAGEHGSHAIVQGPDRMLYYIHGNFVKVPADISPQSPHQHYAEDLLLPRENDGNGFGNGLKPPGGFVVRMDPDAKNCELFAAGLRNTYDFAFNSDGEMFGFDSDMEWDWGTPWYRPTRINHLVSGSDNGFREGTGKWPVYYPDSLPATLDVGIGSPTGLKFGTASKFPTRYKKALYAMDWAYGRLFAVHLSPQGSSYTGTFETFVRGKPLNLTDLEFGKDGAMYFLTGGRGTQSGLYRVSYIGRPSAEQPETKAETAVRMDGAGARMLRHKLESFHGRSDPAALNMAWSQLNSSDRWMRYAARIAIESQPLPTWQDRALAEKRPEASITALLALARMGKPEQQNDLLRSLGRLQLEGLPEAQQLEALRVFELAFIRLGKPSPDIASEVIGKLDRLYPAGSDKLNRELCQLLIYLEAPGVVAKTLALLDAAGTQEEQVGYILHLRTLKSGWTLEQHRHYLSWFNRSRAGISHTAGMVEWFQDAGRDYDDGASFANFMTALRRDAVASLTDAERAELAPVITGQSVATIPGAAPRRFIKDWKMDDLLPVLDQASKGRSFSAGKASYAAAQCAACHRFGNEGGAVGPDLTAISSRFARRDVLESILNPSKVISEQYQNTTLTLKNGDQMTGRIVEQNDQKLFVVTNPLSVERTTVRVADIQKREPSKISPMPEGLMNILTRDEILDLVAYLESGGKANHSAFIQR